MKWIGAMSVSCALALTVACGGDARDEAREDTTSIGTAGEAERNAVDTADRDFVNEMLASNAAEIELGQLANERAANAEVKKFAQMLVQDHTKASEQLKQTASMHSVSTMPETNEKHRDLMSRLTALRGGEFDREYINAMVDAHENAVDKIESRVDIQGGLGDRITGDTSGGVAPEPSDNPLRAGVNQWAANTLPTVRRHLEQARQLQDKLQNRNATASNR